MIESAEFVIAPRRAVNPSPRDLSRFWSKVDKNGPPHPYDPEKGPCWEWTGSVDARGYGRFHYGTRQQSILSHRFSFLIGVPVDVAAVCHTCNNPSCVRPSHLEAGDHASNMAYCKATGRLATAKNGHHVSVTKPHVIQRGDNHWSRRMPDKAAKKITRVEVIEIRRRYDAGEFQIAIGRDFGIGQTAVSRIVLRKCWRHVP
jgi:hypothetical protein